MLPRNKRLNRTTFEETLSGSKRKASSHFSVTFKKTDEKGGAAAVVSKKVAKLSVDRHLLKRRMLEVAGPLCTGSFSFVLYARAGSPALPFKGLTEEITTLLTEAAKEV